MTRVPPDRVVELGFVMLADCPAGITLITCRFRAVVV